MGRLSGHGDVVFHQQSNGWHVHPAWGDYRQWWPFDNAEPAQENQQMGCSACGQGGGAQAAPPPPPPAFKSLDEWVEYASKTPSDFHEHVLTLRDLAAKCEVCVELSMWRKPALLAMCAGRPKQVVSISPNDVKQDQWAQIHKLLQAPTSLTTISGKATFEAGELNIPGLYRIPAAEPFPHDLLFPDTQHDAEWLYGELTRWAPHCRHWIVVHCTGIYGEQGDLGKPGVLVALRRWMREHPEWSPVKHYTNNNGLTILSCKSKDSPTLPGALKQLWNFTKAQTRHKLNGGTYLPLPLAEERLNTCMMCEQRNQQRCSVCSCWLWQIPDDAPVGAGQPGKTFYPTECCPLMKWADRPNDGVSMSEADLKAIFDPGTSGALPG